MIFLLILVLSPQMFFSQSINQHLLGIDVLNDFISYRKICWRCECVVTVYWYTILQIKTSSENMYQKDVGRIFQVEQLRLWSITSQRIIDFVKIPFKNVLSWQWSLDIKFLLFKMVASVSVLQLDIICTISMVARNYVHMEKADQWQTAFTEW